MSVDVRNAFNCVNRSAVAEVVTAIAPNVAPFISWACLQPLPMIVNGNHEVQVTRGVLQGDPLASTLFALVMVKVMRRVVDVCASKGVTVVLIQPRDDVPAHVSLARLRDTDVGMGAYADDCTFAWKCPASAKVVMEVLESELASVGLDLSRPKCVIVCGAGADASVVEAAAADMQVRVEDVANILGVPIGKTDAARALLMTRVTAALDRMKTAWTLDRPMAESAFLHNCGVESQLRWVLEACGDGVVDASVVRAIEDGETELMKHVFGRWGDVVTDIHLTIAARPLGRGGFGWMRVSDAGFIDGTRWRARSKKEREAHEAAMWRKVTDAVAHDRVLKTRVTQLMTLQLERWTECQLTLRSDRYPAGVESLALAIVIGVPVVPQNIVGRRCPKAHREAIRVLNGLSCHLEQCAISITHQRHNQSVRQLEWELRKVTNWTPPSTDEKRDDKGLKLTREMGLDEHGSVAQRARGPQQQGQKIIGDVYYHESRVSPYHYFMDIGWRSISGTAAVNSTLSAAEGVWKAKDTEYGLIPHKDATIHKFIAIGLSNIGEVSQTSRNLLPTRLKLGDAAWRRIMAAGMMAQAEAGMEIITEMERAQVIRDDAAQAARDQRAAAVAAGAAAGPDGAAVSSSDSTSGADSGSGGESVGRRRGARGRGRGGIRHGRGNRGRGRGRAPSSSNTASSSELSAPQSVVGGGAIIRGGRGRGWGRPRAQRAQP